MSRPDATAQSAARNQIRNRAPNAFRNYDGEWGRNTMRRSIFAFLALSAATGLSGCYSPGERALGGAALGGAGGAIVGSAVSGGHSGGALAGAAIGAASGAMIGAATAPQQGGCARWGYDDYGNPVCLAPY